MDVTVSETKQRTTFVRKFASLAEANPNRFDRVRIVDVDFDAKEATIDPAIHCERAWRGTFERLNIQGPYSIGVAVYFGLYTELDNVVAQGPATGFFVGNGTHVWEDATPSNSASNLSCLKQCRFGGMKETDIGFHLDGGSGVIFEQCVVEGSKCGTGWKLFPRAARCVTTLRTCWLEVKTATAIEYDGEKGVLVIDGLDMAEQPGLLLDAKGDKESVIVFRNNTWKSIPPMRIHRSTRVVFEESNILDEERFWAVVDAGRVG